MTDLKPIFDPGYSTESLDFTFFDDMDRDVTVYVTYSKDDPLRLAGLSIRPTKIFNLEWVIKDEWFCDDLTVLFSQIKDEVRMAERNDCEFLDF